MIKVKGKDIADIQRTISAIKERSKTQLSNELAATAAYIARDSKKNAPVDTGNLRKSIGWERMNEKNVRVFAKAPYAPYVEFGTGRAVTLKYLQKLGMPDSYAEQFKGKGLRDGNKVFVYARPYFFPAVLNNYEKLAERLEKLINK